MVLEVDILGMKFEILEHKADLKIRVFGRNKKDLFKNALSAMFKAAKYEGEKDKIINPPTFSRDIKPCQKDYILRKGGRIKRELKIFSFDLPSLLVDFLAEVLYFSEINKEIYDIIKFSVFDEKNIKGTLLGRKLKRMGVQIKGVTYHNLEVRQKKDGRWEATLLFDI